MSETEYGPDGVPALRRHFGPEGLCLWQETPGVDRSSVETYTTVDDGEGRPSQVTSVDQDGSRTQLTYRYDGANTSAILLFPDGNRVEISEQRDTDPAILTFHLASENVTFRLYQRETARDQFGNWTEKIIFSEIAERPMTIWTRKIEYSETPPRGLEE